MNMLLHGVKDTEFEIHHGDTLDNDWDILNEMNPAKKLEFDAVVANPPLPPMQPRYPPLRPLHPFRAQPAATRPPARRHRRPPRLQRPPPWKPTRCCRVWPRSRQRPGAAWVRSGCCPHWGATLARRRCGNSCNAFRPPG